MNGRREKFDAFLQELLTDPKVRYAYHRAGYRIRHRPTLSRCPAPAVTEWGTIRCVTQRDRCTEPGHRRWRPLLPAMALLWWAKPWWPDAKGKAMDRELKEEAHGHPKARPLAIAMRKALQLPRGWRMAGYVDLTAPAPKLVRARLSEGVTGSPEMRRER